MQARFRIAGQTVICMDSPVPQKLGFTPSFSLFVDCQSADEFEKLFGQLGECGVLLMPADDYWFSRRFAWLNDRFGVSWQLNLP